MMFLVTFVSERTTKAVASATIGSSSASGSRFGRTTTSNSGRCWSRAMPLGEIGSQIIIFMVKEKWSFSLGANHQQVKQRIHQIKYAARLSLGGFGSICWT